MDKIFLVLVLVLSTITGTPGGGAALPETIPTPPTYQLLVAQDPADPRVFHIWAPNEVITPVRVEAVVGTGLPWLSGRHFKIEKLEGFIGPFEWHPAFPDGWGVSITFDDVPSAVAVGVAAWDGMDRELRIGYGFWAGPRVVGGEVFLPSVFTTDH